MAGVCPLRRWWALEEQWCRSLEQEEDALYFPLCLQVVSNPFLQPLSNKQPYTLRLLTQVGKLWRMILTICETLQNVKCFSAMCIFLFYDFLMQYMMIYITVLVCKPSLVYYANYFIILVTRTSDKVLHFKMQILWRSRAPGAHHSRGAGAFLCCTSTDGAENGGSPVSIFIYCHPFS